MSQKMVESGVRSLRTLLMEIIDGADHSEEETSINMLRAVDFVSEISVLRVIR